MRYDDEGRVIALERDEMERVLRHLERFQLLVWEFETRDRDGRLGDGWDEQWAGLKAFLQSEELEGSENPEATDGRYCCQWRTRGLVAGQTDCHQYNAWYIFAWLACVGAAIWRGADATLQAGECSRMPGCR
jgi:hypothetical protein